MTRCALNLFLFITYAIAQYSTDVVNDARTLLSSVFEDYLRIELEKIGLSVLNRTPFKLSKNDFEYDIIATDVGKKASLSVRS